MLPMLMSLMFMNVADASRKSDTIRLLNLEKRYEEAQEMREWGALEPTVDPELRGFVHRPIGSMLKPSTASKVGRLFRSNGLVQIGLRMLLCEKGKLLCKVWVTMHLNQPI